MKLLVGECWLVLVQRPDYHCRRGSGVSLGCLLHRRVPLAAQSSRQWHSLSSLFVPKGGLSQQRKHLIFSLFDGVTTSS